MFPTGRYPAFFYCKEVRKQIYFCAHWCVSAASSLIYRSCTLSGFGQRRQWDGGGRGKDFCLPCEIFLGRLFPRRRCDNSSGGVMEMASGCFAALYLAAPGGCSRAPCPDFFVWLPVVGLSAPLFKRHASFTVCGQCFGKVTKIARSTWAILRRESMYSITRASARSCLHRSPKLTGAAVVVVTQAAANSPDFSILSYCTK